MIIKKIKGVEVNYKMPGVIFVILFALVVLIMLSAVISFAYLLNINIEIHLINALCAIFALLLLQLLWFTLNGVSVDIPKISYKQGMVIIENP